MRVAILEDDPDQIELLQGWVTEAGYQCFAYETGRTFRRAAQVETFDMLIVDWNLPDTSGLDIVAWVRSTLNWRIPVILITSRGSEEDVVTALEKGADDYMIKPVRKLETIARLRALERRMVERPQQEDLEFPPYSFKMSKQEVLVDDEKIELRNKEFLLAVLLFQNRSRLLSRGYIMESIWGIGSDVKTRTVDTHISRIRNKLGIGPDRGWKLSAVYQHGYRLEQLT